MSGKDTPEKRLQERIDAHVGGIVAWHLPRAPRPRDEPQAYKAALLRAGAEDMAKHVERMKEPITWQDIRLQAGEGNLSPQTVLDAANAVLRNR